MISTVWMFRKVAALVVQPTEKPRKIVMMFISSLPAVLVIRSTTPDSFIRLPIIRQPTRMAASGRVRATMMVTMMGKRIFSVLETRRGAVMTILRSFSVVRAFMIGGWITGTSAM